MNERRFVGFERSKSLVGGFLALSVLSAACADKRDASPSASPVASAAAPIEMPTPPTIAQQGTGSRDKGREGEVAATATAAPGYGAMGRPGLGGGVGAKADKAEAKEKAPAGAPRPAMKALEANPFDSDDRGAAKVQANTVTPAPRVVPPVVGGAGPADAKPAPKAEAAINPNGRFATTYRPGAGHLSAFEAAVARGVVPDGERELVSDVGARYASDVGAPAAKTMLVATDLERGKLPPAGGEFHSRLTLRSAAKAPAERPHLSVHLVLDTSGSMAGEAIDNARKAAQALVDKLAPTDDFSLVTFSSDARVDVTDGPVGARREQIKKTIAAIKEGGGTNIGDGLILGYQQAKAKGIPQDAVRVVLLLSDGHVNAGILDQDKLAKLALDAFQDGIQTSSFGLGGDYDGPLMSSIASDGAGGYYYLRDSDQITSALTTELDKRLDPVATAVEVRVRLKKGVELLHVYGSRRLNEAESARVRAQEVAIDAQEQKKSGIKSDRAVDQEGGMRFFIPAFARDDAHTLLLKLRAPEGVGSKPLALVELKYKDRVGKKNVSEEFAINVDYAGSDADSFASRNASVVRTAQGFAAGEALAEAAALVNRGDRAAASALLTEREGILREAAATLAEPLFLKDAERLARLRGHTQTQSGMGDPLVLAMLMETASRAHLR